MGVAEDIALGIALQEYECPLGQFVEQRRRRGQTKNDRITRVGTQRFLRQRQKSRRPFGIRESIGEYLCPFARIVRRIA